MKFESHSDYICYHVNPTRHHFRPMIVSRIYPSGAVRYLNVNQIFYKDILSNPCHCGEPCKQSKVELRRIYVVSLTNPLVTNFEKLQKDLKTRERSSAVEEFDYCIVFSSASGEKGNQKENLECRDMMIEAEVGFIDKEFGSMFGILFLKEY